MTISPRKIFGTNPKRFTILALLSIVLVGLLGQYSYVHASGNLTIAKDVVATSRPSVITTISGSVSAGASTITVGSTTGIYQGDSITICVSTTVCSGTTESHTVSSVIDATHFALTTVTTNALVNNDIVEYLATAQHVVSFTTRSTVLTPKFVLNFTECTTACSETGGTSNDNIPDAGGNGGGYDFNSLSGALSTDITCTGFTIASNSVVGSTGIITITASTGSVASGTAISCTIGIAHKLLNPTKSAATGLADTYPLLIQELDSGSNLIDQTTVLTGVDDIVAVTATVAPSFTFQLFAVAPSTAINTLTTNATITPTANAIPFGTIATTTAYTVAQYAKVTTNAANGYTITAQHDVALTKSDGTTTISDYGSTPTDNGNTTAGFGYSLYTKVGSPTMAFQYNDTSAVFKSAGFTTSPVQIISSTGPSADSEAYIIYRLYVAATQSPGDYRDQISYVATPIF
jgi:hypothetical protein